MYTIFYPVKENVHNIFFLFPVNVEPLTEFKKFKLSISVKLELIILKHLSLKR